MSRLDDACDRIDNAFSITRYPKWFRRSFVILSPIAGPLWAISYLLTIIVMGLFMGIFFVIPMALRDLWGNKHHDA